MEKPVFQRLKGDGFARVGDPHLEPEQAAVYSKALRVLNETGIPYILAGAFALHTYTGLWRDTKDLDLFIKPTDLERALRELTKVGFKVEIPEDHWLAKAWSEPYFIDLIFSMANGAIQFDDNWLKSERTAEIEGVRAPLIGLEQLIASKAFVAARDRFDGGDIAHVVRSVKGKVDWDRVGEILGPHRKILLWHFLFFDFVYPGHPEYLPREIMQKMFDEVQADWADPGARTDECRGMLLDPFSFSADIQDWGYQDPRELKAYHEHEKPRKGAGN